MPTVRLIVASLFLAATPGLSTASDDWLDIINWLTEHTEYEYDGQPLPTITYESTQWLQILMYGEEMVARSEMPGSSTKLLTVEALYDRDANHIMLNRDATPDEQLAYLVHELVHYLQDINGAFAYCGHAGEPEAYRLHWQYVQDHGLNVAEPNWLIPVMAQASCYSPHR